MKKTNKLLPMKLQFFAEDPKDNNKEDVKDTDEANKEGKKEEKS